MKPWPAICVGIYNLVLLLLYLLGTVTQISSEGFGFFPLIALTMPWSWLAAWLLSNCTGLVNHNFSGGEWDATLVTNFLICNVFGGLANSFILYFLLRHWLKRNEAE